MGSSRKREPVRDPGAELKTVSGRKIKRIYRAEDRVDSVDRSDAGEYPFTRGIHPTMYRTKLWTMRQFSGFGSPRQTNKRFKYLLQQGQTGLSVAFDLPTLMGIDSDNQLAGGEVGKCGVAVDSLEDMEILFDGINLDQVTTSMTINHAAGDVCCCSRKAGRRSFTSGWNGSE
jgi:methylmalonyl-CoA mutase N-terminal domain/subunit